MPRARSTDALADGGGKQLVALYSEGDTREERDGECRILATLARRQAQEHYHL